MAENFSVLVGRWSFTNIWSSSQCGLVGQVPGKQLKSCVLSNTSWWRL